MALPAKVAKAAAALGQRCRRQICSRVGPKLQPRVCPRAPGCRTVCFNVHPVSVHRRNRWPSAAVASMYAETPGLIQHDDPILQQPGCPDWGPQLVLSRPSGPRTDVQHCKRSGISDIAFCCRATRSRATRTGARSWCSASRAAHFPSTVCTATCWSSSPATPLAASPRAAIQACVGYVSLFFARACPP